jgi:hypothetical protein
MNPSPKNPVAINRFPSPRRVGNEDRSPVKINR